LVPRFFYETNGYWLLPTLPGASVYFLKAPFNVNFNGSNYIYMEVASMNNIDETSPWDLTSYTKTHNQTNSTTNSAFAKIPIKINDSSRWYDNDSGPYKYWNPPAERISKLKFKFRYHNGQICEFGQFQFSFMLEFNILKPQQERSYSIRNAFDLGQNQSYGSKFV
jgi:hypothetical protein